MKEDPMDGELESIDDGWQLRFTRELRHQPETVWRALTEPDQLAAWFPTTIEGERVAGAPLRFAFEHGEGEPFVGTMLAYEPPKVLEFAWGTDILRIELESTSSGCRLTLLDRIDALGKAARDAAGWHVCLDALELTLDRQPSPRAALDGWVAVAPRYRERFGAAASTIGPPEGPPPAGDGA
jgi:uncharacterized protein YndB with AHSA1/START domain